MFLFVFFKPFLGIICIKRSDFFRKFIQWRLFKEKTFMYLLFWNYFRKNIKFLKNYFVLLTYVVGRKTSLICETLKYQAKSNSRKYILFINCTYNAVLF